MIIKTETNLRNFEAWSGAIETKNLILFSANSFKTDIKSFMELGIIKYLVLPPILKVLYLVSEAFSITSA